MIAFLVSDELNIGKPIEFLIDTGASRTTILDNDAIRLEIDYSKLGRFEGGTVGIGGVVDTYILPNVRLVFPTMDGIYEERLKEIFLLKHIIEDKYVEERIKRIPSLLGRDFLNKYTLALDRKRGSVIIADEEIKT